LSPDDLAREIVDLAMRAGATQAEATCAIADRFSTEARGTEIAKLEHSVARGATLRVFDRGAKATLSTSDLSLENVRAFVAEAVAAARFVTADPHGGLPDAGAFATDRPELPTYAEDVRARAPEAKIADALALERVARETDPRIVNSAGSRIADSTTTIAMANSAGFAGSYRASQVVASSGPIARDGSNKRQGSYARSGRRDRAQSDASRRGLDRVA
jgi:PmbA protein